MKSLIRLSCILCFSAIMVTGCSWDNRDTGTAVGAVAGGIAGHAISGGSAAGTVAGAAVGGVAGNQLAR